MGGAPSRETLIRSPVREPNTSTPAAASAATSGTGARTKPTLSGGAAAGGAHRHNEVILIPLIPEYFPNFSCPAFQQLAAVYREPSNQFYYRDSRHTCSDVNAISEAARHSDKDLYKLYMSLSNQRIVETDSELVALHRAGRVFTPVPCAVAFIYDVSRVAAQSLAGEGASRKGGRGANAGKDSVNNNNNSGGGGPAAMTFENTVRIAQHNIRVRIFGFIGDVEFCPASMPPSAALKSPMEFSMYLSKGAGGNYRAQVAMLAAYTYMVQLRRIGITEDWLRPVAQQSLSLFQHPSAPQSPQGAGKNVTAATTATAGSTAHDASHEPQQTSFATPTPDPYADPYADPLQDPYYVGAYGEVDPYQIASVDTGPVGHTTTTATAATSDVIVNPRSDINSKQFTVVENAHLAKNDNTVLPRSVAFRVHRTDVPGLCFLRELRAHMQKTLDEVASKALSAGGGPGQRSPASPPPQPQPASSRLPPAQCALSADYCLQAIRTVVDEEVLHGTIRADYTDRFLLWAAWFYDVHFDDFDGGEAARFRQELAQRNLHENVLEGQLFIATQEPGRLGGSTPPHSGDVWISSENSYYFAPSAAGDWHPVAAGVVLRYHDDNNNSNNNSNADEVSGDRTGKPATSATNITEAPAVVDRLRRGQWRPCDHPKEYPEDMLLSLCRHACHIARRATPHDEHWVINPDLELPEGILQGLLVWREEAAGQVVSYAITPDFLKKWVQSGVDPAETYRHQVQKSRRSLLSAAASVGALDPAGTTTTTTTMTGASSPPGAEGLAGGDGHGSHSAPRSTGSAPLPKSASGGVSSSVGSNGVVGSRGAGPSLTEQHASATAAGSVNIRTSPWQQLTHGSLASSPETGFIGSGSPHPSAGGGAGRSSEPPGDIYNAQSGFVSVQANHEQDGAASHNNNSNVSGSHKSGSSGGASAPGSHPRPSGSGLNSSPGSTAQSANGATLGTTTNTSSSATSAAAANNNNAKTNASSSAIPTRSAAVPTGKRASTAAHAANKGRGEDGTPLPSPSAMRSGSFPRGTQSLGFGTSAFSVEEDHSACSILPPEMVDGASTAMPINVTVRTRGGLRTPLSSYNSSLRAGGGLVGSVGSATGAEWRQPMSGTSTPVHGTPTNRHFLSSTPRGEPMQHPHPQPPPSPKQHSPYYYPAHQQSTDAQTAAAWQAPQPSGVTAPQPQHTHSQPPQQRQPQSQMGRNSSSANKSSSSTARATAAAAAAPAPSSLPNTSDPISIASRLSSSEDHSLKHGGHSPRSMQQQHNGLLHAGPVTSSSFGGRSGSYRGQGTSLLSQSYTDTRRLGPAGGSSFKATSTSNNSTLLGSHQPYGSTAMAGPRSSVIRIGAGGSSSNAHMHSPSGPRVGSADASSHLFDIDRDDYNQLQFSPSNLSAPGAFSPSVAPGRANFSGGGGNVGGGAQSGSYSQAGELGSSYSQLRMNDSNAGFGYSRHGSDSAAELAVADGRSSRQQSTDSEGFMSGSADSASKMHRKEKARPPPLFIPNSASGQV